MKQNSVAQPISGYFIVMIVFATVISVISLVIMYSNLSDAGRINVSGSLRMQSYRFIYEMEHHPSDVKEKLIEYQNSLHSPELQYLLDNYFVPESVKAEYSSLLNSWQKMESFILANDKASYFAHIQPYIQQLNAFVLSLQQFAELKIKIALWVIAISMLFIVVLAYFGIWFIRKRVIFPLKQLVIASTQIQRKKFDHIVLPVKNSDELGLLSMTFTRMAEDLAKLYSSLESEVENKTRRLIAVNRSLLVLYQCSQFLSAKPVERKILIQVLENLLKNEHLLGVELQVYDADYWNITVDNAPNENWQAMEIIIENEKLALLRWKPSLVCPDIRLIESVSQMIGRSLYVIQMQKQQQQLVLMEERSIIARELHDSLAQSLSFFKIQLRLLKHQAESEQGSFHKQQIILKDFEKALNDAYRQLRELLATFRLTVQEANLNDALESVLDSLQPQTTAKITLTCKLPSHIFNAQQQVHLLQILREAVINSIKHSQASLIEVVAQRNENGEYYFVIRDNGIGLNNPVEPAGHYGLTIMKERAEKLGGVFSIQNRAEGGVDVLVTLPKIRENIAQEK